MILAIIGAGRIGLAVKQLLQDDFEIKICETHFKGKLYSPYSGRIHYGLCWPIFRLFRCCSFGY